MCRLVELRRYASQETSHLPASHGCSENAKPAKIRPYVNEEWPISQGSGIALPFEYLIDYLGIEMHITGRPHNQEYIENWQFICD